MSSATITASTSGRCGGKVPPTASWASIWDGSVGDILGLTGTNPNNLSIVMDSLTASYWLLRSWLFFDLSSLPSGINVSAAKLRIYVYSKSGTQSTKQFIITVGVQNDPIVHATDWVPQNVVTTGLGGELLTNFTASQYNDIDLNATGLTFIEGKAGSTCKLCLRTERDIDNDPWTVATNNQLNFYLTQQGTYAPELVLTYTTKPTVTTQACSGTIAEKSTGHGNITDFGVDDSVTQHGHCWSTSHNPTTADSKTTNGATSNLGQFQSDIIDLTPDTTYYVRAYATNSAGTGYGDEVSIPTDATIGRRFWWTVKDEFHWWSEWGDNMYVTGTKVGDAE